MITLEKSITSTIVNGTVKGNEVYNLIGDHETLQELSKDDLVAIRTLIDKMLEGNNDKN